MTADPSSTSIAVPSLVVLAAALVSIGLFVSVAKSEPEKRSRFGRILAAILIIVAILAAGAATYIALAPSSTAALPAYTSQATVVRPLISTAEQYYIEDTVPQNNVTTGPSISVSPEVASVGQNITVTGAGFKPGLQFPILFSDRVGDNILGFKLVNEPLRNVTAGPDGTFSFTTATPATLGGIHYISAANFTQESNGTLFVQRTATINATQGPDGTTVAVVLKGVGWTFQHEHRDSRLRQLVYRVRLRILQQWQRDLLPHNHGGARLTHNRRLPFDMVGSINSNQSVVDRIPVSVAHSSGPPGFDALIPFHLPGYRFKPAILVER